MNDRDLEDRRREPPECPVDLEKVREDALSVTITREGGGWLVSHSVERLGELAAQLKARVEIVLEALRGTQDVFVAEIETVCERLDCHFDREALELEEINALIAAIENLELDPTVMPGIVAAEAALAKRLKRTGGV